MKLYKNSYLETFSLADFSSVFLESPFIQIGCFGLVLIIEMGTIDMSLMLNEFNTFNLPLIYSRMELRGPQKSH